MANTKFGWNHYWARAPKAVKAFGDSLMAASAIAVTYVAISGNDKYMLWVAVAGIAGKFISNFFAQYSLNDEADKKNKQ